MVLDPQQSRITKRQNDRKFLSIIPGLVVLATAPLILPFLFQRSPPKPLRTSFLSGAMYIDELMTCDNPERIQQVLRMKLDVFQFLCSELKSKGGLVDSKFVSVEEQVAMFLFTIARASSNRDVQERFQHSGETVSRHFHAVLEAIDRLIPYYIKLPDPQTIPTAITSNPKFYNFFNNCIGALDGTHVAAKVPEEEAAAFRNRKGYLSQNVLACCDLDNLLFTYVLAGTEGSAHDGAVLGSAFDKGFKVPVGKYYLADAGYGLAPWLLTPYRGVRYHLREWDKSNSRYVHYQVSY